jgi:hypothetical protein
VNAPGNGTWPGKELKNGFGAFLTVKIAHTNGPSLYKGRGFQKKGNSSNLLL